MPNASSKLLGAEREPEAFAAVRPVEAICRRRRAEKASVLFGAFYLE